MHRGSLLVYNSIKEAKYFTTIKTTYPVTSAALVGLGKPFIPAAAFVYLVGNTIVLFSATAGEHQQHTKSLLALFQKAKVKVAIGGLVVGRWEGWHPLMEYRLEAEKEPVGSIGVVRLVAWGGETKKRQAELVLGNSGVSEYFVAEMEIKVVQAAWAGVEGLGVTQVMSAVMEEEEEEEEGGAL